MRFWQTTKLTEMSDAQWESLCDGCARCCLHKLEDEDTDELYFTRVACKLLDLTTCRCIHYSKRTRFVPDCLALKQQDFSAYHWLPSTCAYRLLHEGKPLPVWHPLVSGHADSVVQAGMSIRDFAISEKTLSKNADLEDYVIEWLE